MHTGSVKTSEDIDNIYKKSSSHAHIEYTFTNNKVVILSVTIEVSQNIIIQIVAYSSIKTSLITPAQELKIFKNDKARVKKNNVYSITLTIKYSGTLSDLKSTSDI